MARQRDYLFKRPGSQNWCLRLQIPAPGGLYKNIVKSLGTPDRTEAELRAADEINDHRKRTFHNKLIRDGTFDRYGYTTPRLPPNTVQTLPDGHRAIVTEKHVMHLNADDELTRKEPNGAFFFSVPPHHKREADRLFVPKSDATDDSFIRTWLKHNNLNKHIENEALRAWALFREHVTKKPLKQCNRDDGRKLANLLLELGNKSATVEKKVGHLRAACNILLRDEKLDRNPFSEVVPKRDDSEDREPLSRDDMALVRANAHLFRPEDWLLWRLLATTGMRLGEASQIDCEYEDEESGIRYVLIGTKTDSSRRKVPLPDWLLAELPARIDGPLFTESSETAGKRIRYRLRALGISYHRVKKTGNPRKSIHSMRHRAKDRLRALAVPDSVQYEILGHEIKTVAAGYGKGSPMPILKRLVDQIGY